MKIRIVQFAILAVCLAYGQVSFAKKFNVNTCPVESFSAEQLNQREAKLNSNLKEIESFLVWDLGGKRRGRAIVNRLLAGESVKLPPIAAAAWKQYGAVESCLSKVFATRNALVAPPALVAAVDPGAAVTDNLINGLPGRAPDSVPAQGGGGGGSQKVDPSNPYGAINQVQNKSIGDAISRAIYSGASY